MPSLYQTVSTAKRTFWEVWVEPSLTRLGLYEAEDKTYGRWNVPFSPMERRLQANEDVSIWFGKAKLEDGQFCWYQVWEDKRAQAVTGRKADMLFVHGTGVHSGTFASHARRYLDAGFRLIVPDLPSHGYSTGLHVYQRHMTGYTSGLRAVLHDIAKKDDLNNGYRPTKLERKPTFILGLSFGGLVAVAYGIHFPNSLRESPEDPYEIPIDGIIGVGPMIGYSKDNIKFKPWMVALVYFGEWFLRAGRIEVIVPHKKCVDRDPKVYQSLVNEDHRSHHGAFRAGHFFCIGDAMDELVDKMHTFKHPIYVQQGGQDRVADTESAVTFTRAIRSADKRLTIYPVCQHVIYRKAKTEEEDLAGRIAVMKDNVEWMAERSPCMGRMQRSMSWASDMTVVEDPSVQPVSNQAPPPSMARMESYMANKVEISAAAVKGTPVVVGKLGDSPNPSRPQRHPELNHPLLAHAHPSTLPKLAAIYGAQRVFHKFWDQAPALRPYDLPVE